MGTEAKGILLGPVNVGGIYYRAYLSAKEENKTKIQPK